MSSHPWRQGGTPHPKPLSCLSVELVPGELIENDATIRAQQAPDLIEDNSQAAHVMEHEACDGNIETWGFVQIFDPASAEDPAARGHRVDRHDVIARAVQRSRKPTISAPYFEDASRRCRQL
jgi:hypothetical protein